jgi:hypothetical protein
MANFDLLSNPFAVLGITPRDDASAITIAYEDALDEAKLDEHELLSAQQSLMASRPRLAAELGWLTGAAPKVAADICSKIAGQIPISAQDTATLPPVSVANVCSACLGYLSRAEFPNIAFALADSYQNIKLAAVINLINAERQVAGFATVEQNLVQSELKNLRQEHVQAMVSGATKFDDAGHLMTAIAEYGIERSGGVLEFIGEVVEAFDRWTAPHLHEIDEQIDRSISQLRDDPSLEAPLGEIETHLENWDSFNQAQQLIFEAKNLDEPRSRAIYDKLRELTIWMANEHEEHNSARRISQALLETFPELPTVIHQVGQDIEALDDLLESSKHVNAIAPLAEVVERAKNRKRETAAGILKGNFAEGRSNLVGELWKKFDEAVRQTTGSEFEDFPWKILRSLAVDLHNELSATRAALKLIRALLEHRVSPSDEERFELQADESSLREMLGEPARPVRRRQPKSTAANSSRKRTDAKSRNASAASSGATPKTKNRRRKIGWGIAAAIVGIIIVAAVSNNDDASRHSSMGGKSGSNPTYSNGNNSQRDPNRDTKKSVQIENGLSSDRPAAGNDERVLSKNEIRYCVYHGERLGGMEAYLTQEEARRNLSDSEITIYNSLVDDFNARCSAYRYRGRTNESVMAELPARRVELRNDGRDLLDSLLSHGRTRTVAGPLVSQGNYLLDPSQSADARILQRQLQRREVYSGKIDGVFGSQSRTALMQYQSVMGLTATGNLDRQTQKLLFSGSGM